MRGEEFKWDLEASFCTNRVVDIWNKLSVEVVVMYTITTFKRHLDRDMDRKCIEECDANGTILVIMDWAGGFLSML